MSLSPSITVAYPVPMQVGESPLWQPQEQALYWVDIPAKCVHRWHRASDAHQSWQMESDAACIARAARGGLIVALRSGFVHLDTDNGRITPIAAAPYDTEHVRFNDGRCDAQGRFWVGTMYEPRDKQLAEMLCLERGRVRRIWAGDMTVSNGLAFAADGSSLFHADTTSHTIRRYRLDAASAEVGEPEVLHRFSMDKEHNYGGRPDGATLDSDGNYWCAMFEGGRLLCLSPQGEILREITLPLRCPTMLAFGGPDLKTLYVTSAGNRSAAELEQYPLSGCVLALQMDVAGKIEPVYLD